MLYVTLIIDRNKGLRFSAFLHTAVLQERQYIVIFLQMKTAGSQNKTWTTNINFCMQNQAHQYFSYNAVRNTQWWRSRTENGDQTGAEARIFGGIVFLQRHKVKKSFICHFLNNTDKLSSHYEVLRRSACRLACVGTPLHPVGLDWVGKHSGSKTLAGAGGREACGIPSGCCEDSFNLSIPPCPQQLLETEGLKTPRAETHKSRLGLEQEGGGKWGGGRQGQLSHRKYGRW